MLIHTKKIIHRLLEDIKYPYKRYFDRFMIFLIIVSMVILIVNKSGSVPPWLIIFDYYFVSFIFGMEYLLRMWIYPNTYENSLIKSKLRYVISFSAIINLIAIFPQFRIIRLLKLYHYMHGASSLFDALIKKRFEFIFLIYMLLAVTFTFGTILYILEFNINKNINSYLDALYWALITVSTVGYGDITPVTELGKIVSMFGIVMGIAMISFVTSLMVSAFSERFNELRNQNSLNHINKMKNVVVIDGYGHLGQTIAKKLKLNSKYEPIIIEKDKHKAHKALENEYKVIHADASSAKLVKELYEKDNITAMLTLSKSDIDNIYFILNAKSVYRQSIVYSRMNEATLLAQYKSTKVNGIIEPYEVVDAKALKYIQNHTKENEKKIYFFGYTHKSRHICKMLQAQNISIHIYEKNPSCYEKAKEDKFINVILLENQDIQNISIEKGIVICAMNEEALNVYYSISLRANGFEDIIIALSDSEEDNRKLILSGVNKIFDMYEESATLFVEMIIQNDEKQV